MTNPFAPPSAEEFDELDQFLLYDVDTEEVMVADIMMGSCMRLLSGRLRCIQSNGWLHTTIDEFIACLDTYIRWYNEARIKVSLGARSPVEHRQSLGIAV